MNNPESLPSTLLSNRTRHTRWLVVLLVPVLMSVAPPERPEWAAELMETAGVLCLIVCLVGRGWTSLYIAGRKNTDLVVLGPYSVVRNPLYVFSFIGAIGIGLISEMVTLLALVMVVFVLYYNVVVKREEDYIARRHGESFARYKAEVPRWIPNFSKWRDAPSLDVEPRRVLNHLVDSSLFFLAFIFFEMLEFLRSADLILYRVTLP